MIARSFERIHRSNLVGMGVLPCQFRGNDSAETLGLDGTETYDLVGLEGTITPRQEVRMVVHRADGQRRDISLALRIDTAMEVEYYRHGGILPFVLRHIAKSA